MKDRVASKPNRYAVYDDAHNFLRYEYHERADEPTQAGDALNKANLLPDTVATALGLTGNPQVKDALVAVAPWRLLQAYTVAGAYTFTAPANITEIGVVIIGGGGSGASAYNYNNTYSVAQGGGSGFSTTLTLSTAPGNSYPVVVGAGGAAVVGSINSFKGGLPGGSSTFNGIVAAGGYGGYGTISDSGPVSYPSAKGGQGSSYAKSNSLGDNIYEPVLGTIVPPVITSDAAGATVAANITPNMCMCYQPPSNFIIPFDNNKRILMAGGNAIKTAYQTISSLDGFGNYGSSGSNSASAIKGTSYGCGGGGCCRNGSALSAAGADGAVLIYGR